MIDVLISAQIFIFLSLVIKNSAAYIHSLPTQHSLIVPQASLCNSFKRNLSLGSGVIWFTDWNLAGGYLEVVSWTLLAIIITAQRLKAQTVRGQRCAAVMSTGLYVLWAVGTHTGQSSENWHHTAIILNLFTPERGGDAAVRWMGKCSRHKTQIWNVGGLKHATLPESRSYKETCSPFLWGPAPVQSLRLLKGCTTNINHSQCSLTKLRIPCLKAWLNEYALLWKKASLQLSSLVKESGKGPFFVCEL